jgi:hypothetical protein
MSKIKEKKDRFSLDFPPGAKEKLEELRAKSGASTLTEMFRRATSYYEFLLDAQERGYRLTLEHPKHEKEVVRVL